MGKAQAKIERLRAVLNHQEPDRVPIGDFFWTLFMLRSYQKWGQTFDAYRHFDLDYIVINPNMDPKIQPFEVLSTSGVDITVKTGFGATIRRSSNYPMPSYEKFAVNEPEEMAAFQFDPPDDPRRFFQQGDDQINGVGDALTRDIPAWIERASPYFDDFAVFGSVCEPYEFLWRCIGSENSLEWMALEPEMLEEFINRIGDFMVGLGKAQITAAKGKLSGMYIWGDVAYNKGLLFGLKRWRELFKPHVKRLIDLFHDNNLMVIYHGCGNAVELFDDMVEIGLDCYNPLEAKAGLDAVKLKETYNGKLAFCGNIDVRILEAGDPEKIHEEVLYKLQAAKGGGYIFQSDHSVSGGVAPESYELAVKIMRENSNYPLKV